jgi:hypothetical protein
LSAASQKRRPIEGTDKNKLQPDQLSTGYTTVLSHCPLLRNTLPKPTGVLEHCHEEKQTVGSPFIGVFPYDRVPRVTKDVNVHFFIHSSNSCKLYQRIPGTF